MEKRDLEHSEPLLGQQSQIPRRWSSGCTAISKLAQTYLPFLLLALLQYNAVVTTISILRTPTATPVIYSPANVALQYEIQDAWDRGDDSNWLQGTPDETDAAWEELMYGVNIRVSEEDMYKTQRGFSHINDAVRISDGDYVGVLGVYHSLHCLKLLRVALNQDAYNISDNDRAEDLQLHHYHHCIDFLRDDVMCHGDLTVYRATWLKSSKELNNKRIRSSSRRQCANWDTISSWVHEVALTPGQFKVKPGPYEERMDAE